jgi:hypothetical protein
MADLITPDRFNEAFTIYVNTDGKPIQRSLREMTANEVLGAMAWLNAEAGRLERESSPFAEIATIIEAGGDVPPEITKESLIGGIAMLRQAAEANIKGARLMALVRTNLPQWRGKDIRFDDAVRRFWPGGR